MIQQYIFEDTTRRIGNGSNGREWRNQYSLDPNCTGFGDGFCESIYATYGTYSGNGIGRGFAKPNGDNSDV